jgi:exopolysaccharide biosynthesis polyprenyl glycosylphosphotransferase
MLRRHRQMRMKVHEMLDACIFVSGFVLAYLLRANPYVMSLLGLTEIVPLEAYAWVLFLVPLCALVLEAQGFYDRPLLCSRWTTAWLLFKGCAFSAIALTLVLFFLRVYLARFIPIWFGAISFVLIFVKEELVRLGMRSKIAREQFTRRFVLVGTEDELNRMRAEFRSRPNEGMEIAAEVNLSQQPVEQVVNVLHEYSVNGVILSSRHTHFEQVETVIKACEVEGVEAWLVADFFRTQLSRTSFDDFFGQPVMVFRSTPETSWQSVVKEALDFISALVLLLILSPLFILIPILIRLTSPGAILFRQKRAGLNGQPFTMYKFRTMVTDAEMRLDELAKMNEMEGPVFKMTNDPRVTSIGKWLRKFSLDEFPQLLNVLRGEMSLVGPRPLPVEQVRRFNDVAHRRRLSVKPGMTCLWQVSGRNNVTDFRDWVRLDLEYIDNWSIWLDLKILWRTVPIVITGAGAK